MYLEMLSYSAIVSSSFCEQSYGCDVVYLILTSGNSLAVNPSKSAKSTSSYLYEFTFCPNSHISLIPSSLSLIASLTIFLWFLLRSLPLVKGTTQKVQNLSQPRIIESHAVIPSFLIGRISSYVSTLDSCTAMPFSPL